MGDGREHGRKLVFFLGIQTRRLAPNVRSVESVLEEFLVEIDCVVYSASKPLKPLKPFKPLNPPWIAMLAALRHRSLEPGSAQPCLAEPVPVNLLWQGLCSGPGSQGTDGPERGRWARTVFFSRDPDATFGPECAIS